MGDYIQITFSIAGHQEVNRRLKTFGQDIRDLSPAWENVGIALLSDFAQNFAQEGGLFSYDFAGNKGWEQLMPSTERERQRLGYGGAHPILERTSQLRQSVSQRGTPGNIFDVRPMGLTVGTATPYAQFHQYGSADGIRLPRRTVIGLTSQRLGYRDQAGSIVNMLQQYVKARIAAAGLASRGF